MIDLVTIPPKAREGVVKAAILDVLERASTDPDTIDVTLDGDRVILDGSVRAWGERELAEQAAWSVPGVCSVDDHLSLGR
ncbi:BON domain-containing protein [Methylobacterium flocculans]|uniref:BON domain-containing protein n=1 Tax=Methylobacterium flocculans TaxID=2984843 RepID=UPI0021F2E8D2|nr:BON domain-containing protein [Methylobacterium sp. FF17]